MSSQAMTQPLLTLFGTFKSIDLESHFQDENNSQNRRRMIVACIFTSVAYFLGLIGNKIELGYGNEFTVMLILRLVILFLGLFAAFTAWKQSISRYLPAAMMIYMISVGVSESVEAVFQFDNTTGVLIPLTLIIVLMYYLFISLNLTIAFFPSVFMSVSYTVSLAVFTEAPLELVITLAVFFLLANLYGVYHIIVFRRLRRSEFYASVSQENLNKELQKEIIIRQKAEEQLVELATIDEMTGVYNRRHFMEEFRKEFRRSSRYGSPVSLLMIDADHFKNINDMHGHDVGDAALKVLAKTVASILRDTDIFARFGGEEFVALLPDTKINMALEVAERICGATAAAPVVFSDGTKSITVSIGVTSLCEKINTVEEMLKVADLALYKAKDSGHNRACIIDEPGCTDQ